MFFRHFRQVLPVCKDAFVYLTPQPIFDSLALEAVLTEKANLQPKSSSLLIYVSQPCIVIGKHQNPWLECDVQACLQGRIDIARRISGGGCVYHDDGNLNFSIFTDRAGYNRMADMQVLSSAIARLGVSNLKISDKFFDLLAQDKKLSGTASRLEKNIALHHFTCLVSSNLDKLKTYLNPSFEKVLSSRATSSRRHPVTSLAKLKESSKQVAMDSVVDSFLKSYFESDFESCASGPVEEIVLRSDKNLIAEFNKRRLEMRSWQWIFGRAPPFEFVQRLPSGSEVTIEVTDGKISKISCSNEVNASQMLGISLKRNELSAVNFRPEVAEIAQLIAENCPVE